MLSVSLKMDKIEYRAVIEFFVKEGSTPNEILSNFIKVYGDSYPAFSTIKKWAAEYKRGRTSLEDDPREGCPKSATAPEIIEQMHDMVLDDGRMKVREIAETVGISKERVGYILSVKMVRCHLLPSSAAIRNYLPTYFVAEEKTLVLRV
jgi:histone-lysine N-methyltransferase SETMAR